MKEALITVLVVEDEILIRMDISEALERAGFGVLEAGNADEAIAILNQRDDVRVLFTDIDMPGSMDGLRLAAAVRDKWPPIEIIVTSGHQQMTDDNLPVDGRFFGKPYRPGQIITAVRELLRRE